MKRVARPRRILFAVPFPVGEAASQRFRFELHYEGLRASGVEFEHAAFWDAKTWSVLYRGGHVRTKLAGLLKGFGRRLLLLLRLGRFDLVFVHREMTPIGPPIFEWVVAKALRKPMVYDFDDAIWLRHASEANRFMERFKSYRKVGRICRWADRVSVGNEFLGDYARRFNDDVVTNPSSTDTDHHHDRIKAATGGVPVVGWTGSHSTLEYLASLVPILDELAAEVAFRFVVIADRAPPPASGRIEFVPWDKRREIEDLLAFDIGVMPLANTEWARGKCGFKIMQYMALGIPPVASPWGANAQIIDHGVDGFLCADAGEWKTALRALILDPELRARIGRAAREKAVTRYSAKANAGRFLATLGIER
jgi:glycosyltransferase involved in cell wall biosynthesis